MTLSKKHFIAIAEMLGKHKAKSNLITAIGRYFKEENSRFDTDRFINAVVKARQAANAAEASRIRSEAKREEAADLSRERALGICD